MLDEVNHRVDGVRHGVLNNLTNTESKSVRNTAEMCQFGSSESHENLLTQLLTQCHFPTGGLYEGRQDKPSRGPS